MVFKNNSFVHLTWECMA